MNKWIKLILVVVGFGVLIFVARSFDFNNSLEEIQVWVLRQGILAPLVFIGIYIIATVLALPGSALTIMAGVIFGSFTGIIVVIIGATLGASLCFLISRHFARDIVMNILGKNENFQRLDALTEKNGTTIVAITRLVPLFPFNVLNYGFGLTKIPFSSYVIWSAICMLPGSILYVVGTDAIMTAIRDGEIPWSLFLIVLLIVGILFVVMRRAKKTVKE